MKVAITLTACIFAATVLSAFAEELSNDSMLVRESRGADSFRRKSNRKIKASRKKKTQNIDRRQKKGVKEVINYKKNNKGKDRKQKKSKLSKTKGNKSKVNKRKERRRRPGKGTPSTKRKKGVERKRNKEKGSRRQNNKGKKERKGKKGKNSKLKQKKKKQMRKQRQGKQQIRKEKKRPKEEKKQKTGEDQKFSVLLNRNATEGCKEGAEAPETLDCGNENTTKKVNSFREKAYRILKLSKTLCKKTENIEVFSGYSKLLGQLTGDGLLGTTKGNEAYETIKSCIETAKAECSQTEFSSAIETAKICLNENKITCTNIPKSGDECDLNPKNIGIVDKRNNCLDPDRTGSFVYCMRLIKNDLSSVLRDVTSGCSPSNAASTTTGQCPTCPTCPATATCPTPTAVPTTTPCPTSECGGDEAKATKVKNYLNQANGIKTAYNTLSEKLSQLDVFSNYTILLGKVTENGTTGSEEAKNAYNFLKKCPATAKASCDNSEFASDLATAEECLATVNCTNTPDECNLKLQRDAIAARRDKCLGTETGSFVSCMTFVKDKLSQILCEDLPCPTCSSSPAPTTTISCPSCPTATISCPTCPATSSAPSCDECEALTQKAQTWKKQAGIIVSAYDTLTEKTDQLDVFSNYSMLLGKLTDNGKTGSEEAKRAYSFLTECPATASVFCDNTEFTSIVPTAEACFTQVNCSNTPPECNLSAQKTAIVERRNTCLNETIDGTFVNCMTFVKEILPSILCELTEAPTATCQTIRIEGGEVIKEESSYNPNTRELTINVPSHGDRPATTFIIGETKTVTVYALECLVTDTPDHLLDLLDGAENIGDACNSTVELTEGDLRDRYSYTIGKGVLSEEEIAELPQSIQEACELKIIRFVVTIPTTTPPGNGTIVNPEGCPPPPTPGCAKPKVCF